MTGRRAALVTAMVGSLSAVAIAGATDHRASAPRDQKASGNGSARSHVAVAPVSRATEGGVTRRTVKAPQSKLYLDSSYSFAERAADLVSRMTVAERAAQTISSRAPAIPRLGVAPYGWWNEALHGVSRSTITENANATTLINTTSYPIDQSLGSSWDPGLVHRVATAIGDEAREVSPENSLNLDFYSPTMNLERDPRWGRTDETYGEDPFHVTKLVSQFVNGMEGKDENGNLLDPNGSKKTLTTLKHYAANNSESNRRSGSSDMDDRTLREYYTDAFRRIVEGADPGSVMSSYNSINAHSPAFAGETSAKIPPDPNNPAGAPTADDPYLIDTLLRQTFGFKGYLTSDCDAVFEAVRSHRWTIPSWPSALFARPVNNTERNALAMSAGEDLDCNTGFRDNFGYLNQLPAAVDEEIPTLVDTFNVNDLDTSATRLFEARMSLGEWDENVPWVTEARARVPYGTWTNNDANGAVTETPVRLALAREAGAKSIVLLKNSDDLLPLQVPDSGAFKVAVIGHFANPPVVPFPVPMGSPAGSAPGNMFLGGYSSTQHNAGQAKSINGFDGIRNAVEAINPDADVEWFKGFTGDGITAASLTVVDSTAVTAAAGYDAVIVYVGTDAGTANEDTDRTAITLPGAQATLIEQVRDANPNTIVYMETIGPIDVSTFEADVGSILWSSYNGQRKGEALADVLLGREQDGYNPTGRLPSIWPLNVGQLQPTTDYDIYPHGGLPGRTHWYFDAMPRYPFGHGLSYSDFTYDNLEISDATPDADDTIQVSVEVTNESAGIGTEVVQLYAATPDAAPELQRPIKRLKGFKQIDVEGGETEPVTISLKLADLAFFDQELGRWTVDPSYQIQVGRSSEDIKLIDVIDVDGTLTPKVNVLTVKPTMAGDAARDITTRTVFPEGVTVVPSNTVSMNDDTLYGYVRKGLSKPFPNGMTFEYESNRPGVVKVDGDGTIHTVSNGVATITATVTHEGVSKSTSFVVKVASELDAIKINGKPIGDVLPEGEFQPDRFVYDVIVPTDVTGVPQVSATAPNSDAAVTVTQATAVPGIASIDVAGPDGVVRTYGVHFSRAAVSDDFDASTLGAHWSVIRPKPDRMSLTSTPGSLVITADTGDILNSTPIAGGPSNTALNLVQQPALGDWTIESKLDFSVTPRVASQQGGILAYDDDDNYLKLGWEFGTPLPAIPPAPTDPPTPPAAALSAQPQIALTLEDNRSGSTYPGFAQGSGPRAQVLATVPTSALLGSNKTVWLRLVKTGARYRSYYSVDGLDFEPLYETGASLRNVKVGVFAFNGATTAASDLKVGVDYFHISGQTAPGTFPPPPAAPAPAPTPPGNPADITAPRLRLLSPGRQSLRRLRTTGLSFRIGVDEPVSLRVTLSGQLTSTSAKTSARGKSRRLARVSLTGVRAGVRTVRLKLSASLRRLLRRERRLPARIEVRAVDAAGNVATRSKTLVFR